MDYTPHTEEEIREMLRRVGAASLEDLFAHLPKEILSPPIDLPEPLPEWKVLEELRRLAAQNLPAHKAFLGGGVRSHHVPPWSRPWPHGASSSPPTPPTSPR